MTRRLWTRGLLALVMLCAALLALAPGAALAHVDSPTLILVREDSPDAFSVKIDVDLSLILGSSAEYYAFVRRNPANDDKALRALAAVMVVFHHAQNDAGRTAAELGAPFARLFALPWAAGVDLFFVVSSTCDPR